jgi:hypothetical protein
MGLFFVADTETATPFEDLAVGFGDDEFYLILPVRQTGMLRIVGVIPEEMAVKPNLSFADLQKKFSLVMKVDVKKTNWFSTYHVHHRVADSFARGRTFLLGDAGHIHSPVGGQGMNTGLADAMNLGWKLAAVIRQKSGPQLLATYEPERIAFARTLVATTDSAFNKIVGKDWGTRILRERIVPPLIKLALKFATVRRLIFLTVSQTRVAYHDSVLSSGAVGKIKGGDRLPYLADVANHASLDLLDWQLHVYGEVDRNFAQIAEQEKLRICCYPFNSTAALAGFVENAVYLVRPDGYVGLALASQNPQSLKNYLGSKVRKI